MVQTNKQTAHCVSDEASLPPFLHLSPVTPLVPRLCHLHSPTTACTTIKVSPPGFLVFTFPVK